jgi:hypothetical protein
MQFSQLNSGPQNVDTSNGRTDDTNICEDPVVQENYVIISVFIVQLRIRLAGKILSRFLPLDLPELS